MRTNIGSFGIVAALFCAGNASAMIADGNYNDWFTYSDGTILTHRLWNPANVTVVNPNIRQLADEDGPSPGTGGQDYDIEHIFYAWQDFDLNDVNSGGLLHIGMVTGFSPTGRNGAGGPHYAGDMFINYGVDLFVDAAVAIGQGSVANPGDLTRYGRAWANDGTWATVPANPPFGSSSPYRIVEAGELEYGVDVPVHTLYHKVAWGQIANNLTVSPGNLKPGNERWFLEITIEIADFQEELINNGAGTGGLGLHWTMLCGNDVINVFDDTPLVPVAEPATVVLLGLGVLGIALRARRPRY